jgi:hypothetical protein
MLKKREPRTGNCFLYYHFVSLSFSTLISISAKTSFLLSNAQLASAQQIGPSETSKFFINDALNALRNNDTSKAITQLILAKEQLKKRRGLYFNSNNRDSFGWRASGPA